MKKLAINCLVGAVLFLVGYGFSNLGYSAILEYSNVVRFFLLVYMILVGLLVHIVYIMTKNTHSYLNEKELHSLILRYGVKSLLIGFVICSSFIVLSYLGAPDLEGMGSIVRFFLVVSWFVVSFLVYLFLNSKRPVRSRNVSFI